MKKILIILLMIFTVGCTKKYATPHKEPVKPAEITEEAVTKPEVKKEVVEEVAAPSGKEMEGEKLQESSVSMTDEEALIFKDVLFDYDKYTIRADARPVLDSIATYLKKKSQINFSI